MSETSADEARGAGKTRRGRSEGLPRQALTLVAGIALGASLGPALFLAIDRLELSGDELLSFLIGAFVTFGVCLIVGGGGAILVVPRLLSHTRGTLAGVVEDLTQASKAHARGQSDVALEHLGRAAGEGVAWYSIGASRRFAVQAALGLLIAFGGLVGGVLLFSQNAMIKMQVGLLKDQNDKVDLQLKLLDAQNDKIDQQILIADAQKRSAFATEMFSILQEVAKADRSTLPDELISRIAVLTRVATPYVYPSFLSIDRRQKSGGLGRPLSPERGQLLAALARMEVPLLPLVNQGAIFVSSDLRRANLENTDLSGIDLSESDLTGANIQFAKLGKVRLFKVVLYGLEAFGANMECASIEYSTIDNSLFPEAKFKGANFISVHIEGGSFITADFGDLNFDMLSFNQVRIDKDNQRFRGRADLTIDIRGEYATISSQPNIQQTIRDEIVNHTSVIAPLTGQCQSGDERQGAEPP